MPLLKTLTGLQVLHLKGHHYGPYGVDPTLLQSFSSLQRLVLDDVTFLGAAGEPEGGLAALLAALPGLQQLQELTVKLTSMNMQGHGPAAAAFSALTASSDLRTLQLSGLTAVPSGAWEHAFTAGRKLPTLHTLVMDGTPPIDFPGMLHPEDNSALEPRCFTDPEFEALVDCCPALRHLELRSSLERTQPLDLLLQLTGLTQLHVADVDESAAVVLSDCGTAHTAVRVRTGQGLC